MHSIPSHVVKHNSFLKCTFFNSRSLRNKITDLYSLLDGQSRNGKFDLIFVCETWLDGKLTDGILLGNNNDYVLLRNDRPTRCGGVCAFIKDCIDFVPINVPSQYVQCEVLCVDIHMGCSFKHRFITVYRTPGLDLCATDHLINCLNLLSDVVYGITICGDFNLPNINWVNGFDLSCLHPLEARLASFVVDNGMSQLVHEPTRLTHILDLLLVNDPLSVCDVNLSSPFSTSDHNSITWLMWHPIAVSKRPAVTHFNFHRCNYGAMNTYLSQINWIQLFSVIASNDINGLWFHFKRVIFAAIELFTPLCVTRRRQVFSYPPYVKRALKRKLILWRKRHTSVDGLDLYKKQAIVCQNLIKRFHKSREQRLLSSNSLSAFYRHVNKRLGSSHRIAPLKSASKGTIITDDAGRAQELNNYLLSVFNKSHPADSVPQTISGIISDDVIFTPSIIYKALRGAKKTLSAGPDKIPSILWANIAASVVFPVLVIFTSSYVHSCIPDDWMRAVVRPLLKKGDPSIVSNYRPISLTCTICKIMETIIRDNLLQFALSNNIISNNQYGFLPGRST